MTLNTVAAMEVYCEPQTSRMGLRVGEASSGAN
jgi:hypothetical protein